MKAQELIDEIENTITLDVHSAKVSRPTMTISWDIEECNFIDLDGQEWQIRKVDSNDIETWLSTLKD